MPPAGGGCEPLSSLALLRLLTRCGGATASSAWLRSAWLRIEEPGGLAITVPGCACRTLCARPTEVRCGSTTLPARLRGSGAVWRSCTGLVGPVDGPAAHAEQPSHHVALLSARTLLAWGGVRLLLRYMGIGGEYCTDGLVACAFWATAGSGANGARPHLSGSCAVGHNLGSRLSG